MKLLFTFCITVIAGYLFYVTVFGDSLGNRMYIFHGKKNNQVVNGFACKCERDPTSGVLSWRGIGNEIATVCGNTEQANKGIKFDNPILTPFIASNLRNKPLPDGACCRTKPSIKHGSGRKTLRETC